MHADREVTLARPPRARAGAPYAFDPNLSALSDDRRDSVYSNSCSSSDARDRNDSVSVSNVSEYINRRGSNDSVFSFASNSRGSVSGSNAGGDQDTTANVFRKRKPRSLRNSFESLQVGLAQDPEELSLPFSPLKLDDGSFPALTSQLLGEEFADCDGAECSCSESEDGLPHWGREGKEEHFPNLLSPISETSSSESMSCNSPLSPAELSQRLWQGLVNSTVLSPPQPRRARRVYRKRSQGCNCEKSKCLKLYCECFAKQAVCGPECHCKGCMNTAVDLESREKAIQASLDRSTNAFFRSPETGLEHKGCRCKKSQCRKNYCECFSVSRSCTQDCRCTDCGNVHGVKLPQPRRPSVFVSPLQGQPPPPPPPPRATPLTQKAPPPPPLPGFREEAGRLPPPPPPRSSLPNLSSLVVSKFRKDTSGRPSEMPPLEHLSGWPNKHHGEEHDMVSPFAGFPCPPLADPWSAGDSLATTWEDNDGFYCEEEEAKKPLEINRGYGQDQPSPLALEGDCADFLMEALGTPSN